MGQNPWNDTKWMRWMNGNDPHISIYIYICNKKWIENKKKEKKTNSMLSQFTLIQCYILGYFFLMICSICSSFSYLIMILFHSSHTHRKVIPKTIIEKQSSRNQLTLYLFPYKCLLVTWMDYYFYFFGREGECGVLFYSIYLFN